MEEFMRLFELQTVQDRDNSSKLIMKAHILESRMVIRGKDVAHHKRIFDECLRRLPTAYFVVILYRPLFNFYFIFIQI